MTKCGRYGVASFDYSPARIRASVKQSLERLKTNYLDVVYLHDVEFVCTPCAPKATGNHASALHDDATSYGLSEGDEGLVRGEGDQLVLDAFAELRTLQEEGLIRRIGITGIFSFQSFIMSCASQLVRLSTPDSLATLHLDLAHGTIQTCRYLAFIFTPLLAELHIYGVCTPLLPPSKSGATARCVTSEHGPPHAMSSKLASSSSGPVTCGVQGKGKLV